MLDIETALLLRRKFNPNHAPAGGPGGGQFTSGSDGGGSAATATAATDPKMSQSEAIPPPPFGETSRATQQFIRDTMTRASELPYDGSLPANVARLDEISLGTLNRVRGGEIIAASGGKLTMDDVKRWGEAWGRGTGGQDWAALQQATSEEFGLPLAQAQSRVDDYKGFAGHTWQDSVDSARVFARACYVATQNYMAAHGMDEVTVFRGVGYNDSTATGPYKTAMDIYEAEGDGPNASADGTVPQKPLASWAIEYGMAKNFAENYQGTNSVLNQAPWHAYLITTKVPRQRVLGISYAGIGVPREGEYVLLGGPLNVHVQATLARQGR